MNYKVFTDGSCTPVRKRSAKARAGGWAAIINGVTIVSGCLTQVDFYDCEIIAVIKALKFIESHREVSKETLFSHQENIEVFSDCDTLVRCYRERDKGSTKPAYKRPALLELIQLVKDMPWYNVSINWSRRDTTEENKIVDLVATQERKLLQYQQAQEIALNDAMNMMKYQYETELIRGL